MHSDQLTNEESLKIITAMINQAKGNFRESTFYFKLWGWLTIIASLTHFYLDQFTEYQRPYIVWLITIPGWIISFWYGYKNSRHQRVVSYSDSLIMWTWIAYTLSILIIIFAGSLINYQITPLILILTAFATFISGKLIQFRPLIIGGSSLWFFAALAFYVGPQYSPLIIAVGVLCGYLIPAYMIKSK